MTAGWVSDAVWLFHCNDAHAAVHRFCAGSVPVTSTLPPQGEDTPAAEGAH